MRFSAFSIFGWAPVAFALQAHRVIGGSFDLMARRESRRQR